MGLYPSAETWRESAWSLNLGRRVTYNVMNVCRTIWVSVQQLNELSSRAIHRNLQSSAIQLSSYYVSYETYRIGRGPQTIESVLPLLVGQKLAAQVMFDLILILLLVQS